MTKKGPLSKAEKFYIEHKCSEDNVDALAKDLDRAKNLVKSHVEQCKTKNPDMFNVVSQMATRTGIAIMTENASSMSDQVKKEKVKRPGCTTTIKKNG